MSTPFFTASDPLLFSPPELKDIAGPPLACYKKSIGHIACPPVPERRPGSVGQGCTRFTKQIHKSESQLFALCVRRLADGKHFLLEGLCSKSVSKPIFP